VALANIKKQLCLGKHKGKTMSCPVRLYYIHHCFDFPCRNAECEEEGQNAGRKARENEVNKKGYANQAIAEEKVKRRAQTRETEAEGKKGFERKS
jgi:hypothetical protein